MLNIRRVDHAASHTHCWRVTVQRRKRIFVRDFSDGRHALIKDANLEGNGPGNGAFTTIACVQTCWD